MEFTGREIMTTNCHRVHFILNDGTPTTKEEIVAAHLAGKARSIETERTGRIPSGTTIDGKDWKDGERETYTRKVGDTQSDLFVLLKPAVRIERGARCSHSRDALWLDATNPA